MEIALIASDKKKELMAQLCIAYCGILSKHNLCATGITGKYISDATGLKIERLLNGKQGGEEQILSRISYDEIDALICFRDHNRDGLKEIDTNLIRLCDIHNVPLATNIATAEILIRAIDRGDLDWRNIVNPGSSVNREKNRK